MIRMIAWMVAAAVLLPTAWAHDAGTAAPSTDVSQVNEAAGDAVRVVDDFLRALKAGEVDAAAAHLDEDLLVLEAGGAEHSREEYLAAHAHADAAFLAGVDVHLRRRAADAAGPLAWVLSESVMRGEEGLVIDAAETMLLRQVAGTWRIFHIHWSSKRQAE